MPLMSFEDDDGTVFSALQLMVFCTFRLLEQLFIADLCNQHITAYLLLFSFKSQVRI